ncbi:hypothetical protein Daura_02420 [Dactylosporangium aurantiacum]|uniref:Uncharacterized protein n=1 Tax=Dactylosporangium aurantiacum TaxID=35754 RepID=A0A9Q9IFL2_9ACTN|nr:hypothetical protein [Dactylosporangium aurantiacum]MDG6100779.1 hypothetical protein [Dactylosporangium aurantiacum]UWZ55157.1 hypothetical protein Daura_02420 [Dactylosporangium aurantiacum]
MRTSALRGAWLLVLGLAALSGTLYYDQANIAGWTSYPASSNAMNGPAQALTAQIFTLVGAFAAAGVAVLVAVCALLFATGRRFGHWALRLTVVLTFVLLALVAVVVVVASLTSEPPAALIDTPVWLLLTEWAAVATALLGAGITTSTLWQFADAEAPV